MGRSVLSKRYAQAVFKIAHDGNAVSIWREKLGVMVEMVENGDFVNFLDAPQIPTMAKISVIKTVCREFMFGEKNQDNAEVGLFKMVCNILGVLSVNNIVHLLPEILEWYGKFVDEYEGVVRGEIISAVALTEEQSLNLDRMISRIVGVPVKFRTTIDPEIIGGIVATIGDRRIDGSVNTTFKEMRRVVVG